MSGPWLSIWLRHWSLELWQSRQRRPEPLGSRASEEAVPFVLVMLEEGVPVLRAVNATGWRSGLRAGMRLADAYACCPSLTSSEADPEAERAGLEALARWCQRWSPTVVVDPEIERRHEGGGASLLLDMAGCLNLLGGTGSAFELLEAEFDQRGLTVRLALAADPLAAWAWARFGLLERAVLERDDPRLQDLPLAALRLEMRPRQALERLGFRRIGQVVAMSRGSLTRRYGPDVVYRLDQLLGRRPWPLTGVMTTAEFVAGQSFAQPIGRTEDIAAVAQALLRYLCRQLEHEEKGALCLELALIRPHGQTLRLEIGLVRPSREASHLKRLLALRLEGLLLRTDEGIERVELRILEAMPLRPAQTTGLGLSVEAEADLARLADQLELRLGQGRVGRLEPVASHLPERAVRHLSLAEGTAPSAWPSLPPRPLRLLAERPRPASLGLRPEAIDLLEGPERIEPEWWRPEDGKAGPRDYVVATLRDGRRLWLCREDAGRSLAWEGWSVHGYFD